MASAKQPLQMPVDIVAQQRVGDRAPLAGGLAIPVAHNRLGIKQIDREFDEGRPLHALARRSECFFDGRADVPDAAELPQKLHMRRDNGALIDVLQGAAALQQCWRGPSQQHDGRLSELRVFQCGHRIGEPRPRRHRRNSNACQPGDGIGGKHRGRLAPRVYDAHAARFRARENGRDVAAA